MKITGTLHKVNGDIYKDGEFKVSFAGSESNKKYTFKTSSDGRFSIRIPDKYLDENTDVTFKIYEKRTQFMFFTVEKEVSTFRSIVYVEGKKSRDLGKIQTTDLEDIGSKKLDLISAGVKAQFQYFLSGIKEKIDEISGNDNHRIEHVIEGYGFDKYPKVPLNTTTWYKFFADGICFSSSPLCEVVDGKKHLVFQGLFGNYNLDQDKALVDFKLYFTPTETNRKDNLKRAVKNGARSGEIPRFAFAKIRYLSQDGNHEKWVKLKEKDLNETHYKAINHGCFVKGELHHVEKHFFAVFLQREMDTYLDKHPMVKSFREYFDYVRNISAQAGAELIVGETGVINVSALSPDGIQDGMNEISAGRNPFENPIKTPINGSDRATLLRNTFIEKTIQPFVRSVLDNNRRDIENNWEPVHTFFKNIWKHSPAYSPKEGKKNPNDFWFSQDEFDSHEMPARTKKFPDAKKVQAYPQICKDPKGPKGYDWNNIENFWVNALALVWFDHSFNHLRQLPEEVLKGENKGPQGNTVHVTDLENVPQNLIEENQLDAAQQGGKILKVFEDFQEKNLEKYNLLGMAKDNLDLQAFLSASEEPMAKLGFPIENILGTICI